MRLLQKRTRLFVVGWMIGMGFSAFTCSAVGAEPANEKALHVANVDELKARAEKGDAKAQAELGRAYRRGEGVTQDHAEAIKWYQRAAGQGDSNAIETLKQLTQKAFRVNELKVRAVNGDAKAQVELGMAYGAGDRGVARNDVEAVKWLRKAAEQGHLMAKGVLERLTR